MEKHDFIDASKNAVDLIKLDLERHCVLVALPGEDDNGKKNKVVVTRGLFLIELKALTSTLKDFCKTFSGELNSTQKKLAENIFGEKETLNTYGVLVDNELKIVFAFNRDFADYDSKEREIVYVDPDKYLFDKINSLSKPPRPSSPGGMKPPSGGGMMIRYSLTEKEKKEDLK